MVHLIEGIDPVGMPSMAQDRIAQRKTEVEEFAGTICRLAAKHDIQVPQKRLAHQRIREIRKRLSSLGRIACAQPQADGRFARIPSFARGCCDPTRAKN